MLRLFLILVIACGGAARRPTTSIAAARVLDHRGELVAARTELSHALADARGDRVASAELLAELARLAGTEALATNAGYVEGIAEAREAQQAARAAGARHALPVAIDAEGMLHYAHKLWAGAVDFAVPRAAFERAVAAYRAAGDAVGIAEATFHVGLTYEQEGDLSTASTYYRHALEARDDAITAYAERHLAGIAADRGDLASARRGFTRSLALREQLGFARLVPAAHIAIANIDLQEGAIDAALVRYRRALALATQIGHPLGLLWAHLALGGGLEKSGAREEALEHYQTALALAAKTRVTIGIAAAKAAIEHARSGS